MGQPRIGVAFPRELPARLVVDVAERLDAGGADELWVVEDCFYTSGIALAAAALARTEHLSVGIGILPAVIRNPAITAMELATLAGLAPGRLIAGIGHGVQEWMDQVGARPESPVAALGEVITAVRALLAGETVNVEGRYVQLRDVTLVQPPDPALPVLAGVRGPKSLAAAGRCADGVVLAELTGPTAVAAALDQAAPADRFDVVVYSPLCINDDRAEARRTMSVFVSELVGHAPAGLRGAPFFDELTALVERDGADGVATMPDAWWTELAAVGTPDDIAAHVAALGAAGATSVALFLPPFADAAADQLGRVVTDVVGR
jgi:5,10-methylenetetrahydromethanopterin reductase